MIRSQDDNHNELEKASSHDTSSAFSNEESPVSDHEAKASDAVQADRPSDYALPNKSPHDSSHSGHTVVEADDYIYAKYHGKRTRNYYSSSGPTSTDEDKKGHHHHHSKTRRKKRWAERPFYQKLLIVIGWIFASLLALLLIAALVIFLLHSIGMLQLTDYTDLDMTAPTVSNMDVSVNDSGRTVTYNGKEYAFNSDVTSILCIGVDKHGFGLEDDKVGTAGQCDALYLIALNTATGETKIIAISRDIVTDIGIYSEDGEYLRTEKMQLCLAYAYGNGTTTSCLNTVTAVSRLFYQLPINSYFAINLDAISDLNDAIGGVTVTLKDDLYIDSYEVRHYSGETVTLYGVNAERYLRMRDIEVLESSYSRMQHQINYLEAFTRDAINMTKKDIATPINLYNIVADNSFTNLNTTKMTAFATCIVGHGINELEFTQIPGTVISDGKYAQYVVDEKGFYEIILDTFYKEK